jgi:myo-inositol 2-dehydrogenase/D-chiro-inositol 1-dehydrogenase
MDSTVGIGIIGAGFMGMLHARALSQLADVRVLAAGDPALNKAPRLPGQPLPIQLCSDHSKLLENPDIQAVVIATPEDLHRQAVEDAATAGKHILLVNQPKSSHEHPY